MSTKPEYLDVQRRDGSHVRIIVPKTSADVLSQPDIPAFSLALIAFAPIVDGRRMWSNFTRATLVRLQDHYGDDFMRRVLANLLDDIQSGLRATNPIGLLIHRMRIAADSTSLCI